jgi:Bacterial regulatory proteins, luxR family.
MQLPDLGIEVGKENHIKNRILIDLNVIPTPTGIYVSSSEEVYLNKYAREHLEMEDREVFDINRWLRMNQHIKDFIINASHDAVFNQKVLVTLFNGKRRIMNFSLSFIRNPTLGKIYFIHFSKTSEKYSMSSIAAVYSIKNEISKLKPYLNNAGKQILQNVMTKYFFEEDQQLTLDDMVYYEKELRLIQKAYPFLSQREVILCSLLVNKLDCKDIATITNRTIDSVYVTIHRINKKLNLTNKNDLIKSLNNLKMSEIKEPTIQ